MSYRVPRNPASCSGCIAPENIGNAPNEPCQYHRGPDGTSVEYTGRDAYEPSGDVLHIVGKHFTASGYIHEPDLRVYECFAYDPRHGFWMRTIDDGKFRQTNVSESAIGRTYHRVQMKSGAWSLLKKIVELGRMPTVEESDGILLDAALDTLRWNLLVTRDAVPTERGLEKLSRFDDLRWELYLT